MKTRLHLRTFILLSLFLCSEAVFSEQALSTPAETPSPEVSWDTIWNRDWYTDQGIKLPRQVGVGVNYIYMKRQVNITDVSVTLGSRPPQSISNTVDFELENETTLSMIRADAWVLPFLDLYLLAGETRSDAALSAIINVEDPDNPGTIESIRIDSNDQMKGPLMGVGATIVYGGDAWFAMCDANYSRTEMEVFDSYIDALFASARLGLHATKGRYAYRAWGGLAYLHATRTLTITENTILGPISVDISQQPLNPWNAAVGGSIGINNRWELLIEYGSNFDDATLVVLAASVRFL